MKILAIRGRNLASLADGFEVDFRQEPLAGAGLFAISGPTGSGKSTLLDALCLALYGATPRLAQATGAHIPDVNEEQLTTSDPRNLLRRGKAEGHAEVDFVGIDQVAYRARWSVRRARNRNDGRLQNVEYQLTRVEDNQPVAGSLKSEVHAAIVRLVGLSFNQFTRAVLLAQNDFATFLKASDDERAALLQTLTGTERFERLSMRIHERAMQERKSLELIEQQLAGDPPLDGEARGQLEKDLAEARAALEAGEKIKIGLEAAQRWHQELARLEGERNQGQARLQQAQQDHQAAAQRRSYLARVEAVAPARPLMADWERLGAETEREARRLLDQEKQFETAAHGRDQAEASLARLMQALTAAQTAQAARQPDIEAAKRLDTQITTLAPSCQEARRVLDAATAEVTTHQARHHALVESRTATVQGKAAADAWLEAHVASQSLATDWSHWDYLLGQAEQAHGVQRQARAGLARLQQAEKAAREEDARQAQTLGKSETERTAAAEALTVAQAGLSRFDPDAQAQAKVAADARRTRLAAAGNAWTQWQERRSEHELLSREITIRQQSRGDCATALQRLASARPGLEGQLLQAERALQLAQAACTRDVDGLRAALADGTPCPVCGATEHPYAAADSAHRLQELLQAQQAEFDNVRRQLDALIRNEASQGAKLQGEDAQLAALVPRLEQAGQRLQDAARLWETILAGDAELVGVLDSGTDLPGWINARQMEMEAHLKELAAQEGAWRTAQKARDAAQERVNRALQSERQAREGSQKAREAWDRAQQAIAAEQTRIDRAAADLDAACAQLDGVLVVTETRDHGGPTWREAWRENPAAYRQARKSEVEAWQARLQEQARLARTLEELTGQINSVAGLLARAVEVEVQQRGAWTRLEAQVAQTRQERACLLEGRSAAAVAAELAAAVHTAQAAVTQQEQGVALARSAEVQAATARDLARKTLAGLQDGWRQAETARDDWLAACNTTQTEPITLAELRALLGQTHEWLAGERTALAGLDQALSNAETLLRERQTQHGQHLVRADQEGGGADAETITRRLAELLPGLEQMRTRAGEQDYALRQDNERRTRAATLVEALGKQTAVMETWGRLNEVIGSANGTKFRRIAQQYTLDVLLGYANRHLADLSRRYRLERLPDSLTLLVVDQDQGDERRSVHSLSGGESFLVSLALALGLASLSSHSVRVESLFIDEGFGSLDVDTLAVAMDALDNLQTQGRKVGVISHVHEMAERIGVQIQVRPQSGGQSRLSVVG